MFDKLFI